MVNNQGQCLQIDDDRHTQDDDDGGLRRLRFEPTATVAQSADGLRHDLLSSDRVRIKPYVRLKCAVRMSKIDPWSVAVEVCHRFVRCLNAKMSITS